MILPGTYHNGFAPRDGEPLYPELWKDCIGAWNPGLGPSGLTLRDWSGFKNHGTLTNMDPGTDWVVSQGRYALDFDGSDDAIITTSPGVTTSSRSVSLWFRTNKSYGFSQYGMLLQWGTAASFPADQGKNFEVIIGTDGNLGTNAIGISQYGNATGAAGVNDNLWHHGYFENFGTTYRVWVDGKLRATKTMTTNASAGTIRIGSSSTLFYRDQMDAIGVYNRTLHPNEIRLLATRRGIAYEMAPRRRASVAAAFNRRRRLLIGASS